jgi:vacuolar protein sorting-associated protein IST1
MKFGKEFATAAVQNRDNCVNARVICRRFSHSVQIVHKLSIQTPENYLVFQYLNEIAKMYNLEWKAEYTPEPVKIEPLVVPFHLILVTP